jgi:hypothetical protein
VLRSMKVCDVHGSGRSQRTGKQRTAFRIVAVIRTSAGPSAEVSNMLDVVVF